MGDFASFVDIVLSSVLSPELLSKGIVGFVLGSNVQDRRVLGFPRDLFGGGNGKLPSVTDRDGTSGLTAKVFDSCFPSSSGS
jgi:hypothetical protein